MQEISNSTESNSDNSCEVKDSIVRESNDSQKDKSPFRLIHAANKKIRLFSVFKTYNISIKKNYNNQAWSSTITCPLPSHKGARERTPSFGYNFVQDRFFCLGCKCSGRAVEFIAEMEGKKRNQVAQSILDYYASKDYSQDILEESLDEEDPKIELMLLSVAAFFRNFYQTCSDVEKISQVDKIAWWFDSYLTIRAGTKQNFKSIIDVEELEARVSKVQYLLKEIGY
jgi:hypothetical protein